MKTIECKIGDIFCIEDGTKLEVTKSVLNCKSCYFFNDKDKSCSRPKNIICSAPRREDKEFVIFKQVKDNNMEEKRNIQISLEEAKEWYNSGDSFKKELALKAYKEEELRELNYSAILDMLPEDVINKNIQKYLEYRELINVASYLNSKYPVEYRDRTNGIRYYYIITKDSNISVATNPVKYRGFTINRVTTLMPEAYSATFNSLEAAKKTINILGDKLKLLFK